MAPTKDEMMTFAIEIERLVHTGAFTYIEAITHYCVTTGLEIESASKLINQTLKAKIADEAGTLNLIKKTNVRKLPL